MTDFTELLTGVLAEHVQRSGTRDGRFHCWCGWKSGEREGFPAHLAAVLAPVVARAQAEAWDTGHETDEHGRDNCACLNPYRASDLDPTNEGGRR